MRSRGLCPLLIPLLANNLPRLPRVPSPPKSPLVPPPPKSPLVPSPLVPRRKSRAIPRIPITALIMRFTTKPSNTRSSIPLIRDSFQNKVLTRIPIIAHPNFFAELLDMPGVFLRTNHIRSVVILECGCCFVVSKSLKSGETTSQNST